MIYKHIRKQQYNVSKSYLGLNFALVRHGFPQRNNPKHRDIAKINDVENNGKPQKDDKEVKNVLICPHGHDVSRDTHGNFSQKINCLVPVAPFFSTVDEHV